MECTMMGPEIDKSALLIVDMQNDFVHPEGGFAHFAREAPEAGSTCRFSWGPFPMCSSSPTPFGPRDGRSSISHTW
jgi:nicotinamidase-related amidase